MVAGVGGYNQATGLLGKSQTGMQLLQQAQAMGVKIEFSANKGDGVMGYFDPQKNTVVINQNDPEKMTETLAHELFHAVTKENGNSMNEELAAFILGEKVSEEAGVNVNKHDNKFWENHVNKAYGGDGLVADNGALNSLKQLGVDLNATAPAAAGNTNTGLGNNGLAAAIDPTQQAGGDGFDAMLANLWASVQNILTGGRTGMDQQYNQFRPLQGINALV